MPLPPPSSSPSSFSAFSLPSSSASPLPNPTFRHNPINQAKPRTSTNPPPAPSRCSSSSWPSSSSPASAPASAPASTRRQTTSTTTSPLPSKHFNSTITPPTPSA